jgi:hypothetical protein
MRMCVVAGWQGMRIGAAAEVEAASRQATSPRAQKKRQAPTLDKQQEIPYDCVDVGCDPGKEAADEACVHARSPVAPG